MVGSTWYLDNLWGKFDDYEIVYLNCDNPGFKWATLWGSVDTEEISDFIVKIVRDVFGNKLKIEAY